MLCQGRVRFEGRATRGLCALLLGLAFATTVPSMSLSAEIWYEDNNMGQAGGSPPDFVEKFRQPETFDEASEYIDVYLIRANVLDDMDDAFFTDLLFPYLKTNGIELAINSGGATFTQAGQRREDVFAMEIDLFSRIKRLGGRVDHVSLQSSLSKPRRRDPDGYSLESRLEDAVNFAKAARAVFPDASIGLIDALPSKGQGYEEPYRLLGDALAQEGIDLEYIHLDISFDAPRQGRDGVTWGTIRDVETYVQDELGVQFGLFAKSRRAGQTSSEMFHRRVIDTLECYSGIAGAPDDYVLASWFDHPERTIPEDATGNDYPFMRTVLEFGRALQEIDSQGPRFSEGDRRWQRQCEARR